jgi:hypothetical protein
MRNLDSCRLWWCMLCPCKLRNKLLINFWNRTTLLCMPCIVGLGGHFQYWRYKVPVLYEANVYLIWDPRCFVHNIYVMTKILWRVWVLRHRSDCCLVLCCWPLPVQSFSGPSPLGLATIFYCLRFEISLFFASYDSQGHGGGIRSCLHTGVNLFAWVTPVVFKITPRHGPQRKHIFPYSNCCSR